MNRNILNMVMTVLLLLVMNYRFTGNALHEIGGIVLFLLFFLHNVLNRRWYEVFFKGRQSPSRLLMTLVNLLLVIMMFIVFVTGALISATVFAPLDVRSRSLFVHDLHQGAAFASFILIAIHLGMHWEMLMAKLKKRLHIDASSMGWVLMRRILSVVIIIYGIYASFANDIGKKLLMQRVFLGWGEEPSLWQFWMEHLAIIGSYVGLTHFLLGLLRRDKNKSLLP